MIEINQTTSIPRIIRGLAILDLPNRNVTNATQVAGLIPLVTAETDCRGAISGCFTVFADAVDTDTRKNDKSMFLCDFTDDTGGNLYKLQKDSGAGFVDIESPFVSGTFYGYNTWDAHQQRAGIEVDWRTVLLTYGVGEYRIVVDGALFSYPILLREFSCNATINTVRLDIEFDRLFGKIDGEGYHKFILGDGETVWTEQVRYKGGFGRLEDSSEAEKFMFRDETKRTQRRQSQSNYNLFAYANEEVLNRFFYYGMSSDFIKVTEYNELTGKYKTDFAIQLSGESSREYSPYTDLVYRISVEVERAIENLGSRACI
jgi:hypothetical protein